MPQGAGLLKRAIKASGLTQEDYAAEVLCVSRRTLARMLSGERPITREERQWLRYQIVSLPLSKPGATR